MKNIVTASILLSPMILAGPAGATVRCDFLGMNHSGVSIVVRHPLPDEPNWPITHTNKHVVWLVEGDQAQFAGELGWDEPAIVATGDFVPPGGNCDAVWEVPGAGNNAPARLVVGSHFTQVTLDDYAQGVDKPSGPWNIAGAFDIGLDGWADLLWWNASTGGLLFWNQTATGVWQSSVAQGGLPTPWRPVAVAQLEPGGPPGLVWSNPGVNQPLYYQRILVQNGLALQSVGPLSGQVADPGWAIVAVGDFNHDGKEDVMRQQQGIVLGPLQICFMNGLTTDPSGCVPLEPERLAHPDYPQLNWYVVGAR